MEYGTSEFKRGLRVEFDGEPYSVIDSDFMKPGKGQAVYRLKCRNLLTGRILDKSFRSGDKVKGADVTEQAVAFSYKTADRYVFMDTTTYEQHEVMADVVGDAANFLLEEMPCSAIFWNGHAISIEPPRHVELVVEYCEPGAKGNTATSVNKPAKLETGCEVQVPGFINIGDVVKIDSRTGEYVERVSKA